MEHIRSAIQKAREQREANTEMRSGNQPAAAPEAPALTDPAQAAWDRLPFFRPNPHLMAKNRIITFGQQDSAHVPFDIMRTRILSTCRQNNWRVVGITSPDQGCGKTVTSLNLAFSFARQKDARTVLVDADLHRPQVGQSLGITGQQSMGKFLSGSTVLEDHFVAYGDTLAIGTNHRRSLHSAELLQDRKATEAMELLSNTLQPDIIIVDLPPVMVAADVMAFASNIDAILLIGAAGHSRLKDIEKCERELAGRFNVMGVVLNKCRYMPATDNYRYY